MDITDLMRLAGRPLLLEALTPPQAAAIFVKHGADETQLGDVAYLKKFKLKINKASHQDAGGDGKAAAEVNAALAR